MSLPDVSVVPFGFGTQVVLMWAGSVIGGERVPRDRATEFISTGTVADLHTALDDVVARLPAWVDVAVTDGIRDRTAAPTRVATRVATATPEWVLGRLVRELAQHLGHSKSRATSARPGGEAWITAGRRGRVIGSTQ